MYYEFIQRNKQRVVAIFLLLFAVIVIWSISTTINRQGKIAVVVSAVPNDAQITFSGSNEGNGTRWIKPGDYTVIAKKDGFTTVTKKVRITDQKSQNVIALSLHAESDDAKNWANTHMAEYQKNEMYGTIEANTNGEYFSQLNPITTKLPFIDPYFKIAYETNSNQSIRLTVSTPSPRYRFYALEKIRNLGYDPTDFTIVFKDFKNPLESKQ
ncbi:MAG: PEGA domain-containing protein [Candidatus Saccharimonadales bacterium]